MSLIDKLRKARQHTVTAGGYTFTVRRPTDFEALRLQGATPEDIMVYVVGWSGVREIDLIPGGTAVDVPFDPVLFREWIADRPDLWGAITTAVTETYARHVQELEGVEKN